jgi:hypothetical protein
MQLFSLNLPLEALIDLVKSEVSRMTPVAQPSVDICCFAENILHSSNFVISFLY